MKKIREFVKNHKLTTIMILVAAVLAGYFVYKELLPKKSTGTSYELGKVTKGNIETVVSATGQVGDTDQSDITAEVSGEVTKVAVTEGQEVKAGDLIAQINTSDLDNQIYQAQLAVQSAQLSLKKLQEQPSDYDIKKSENDLQTAKNNLSELELAQKNQLAAAKEDRAIAQDNLNKLDTNSPDYASKKSSYQSQISAADRQIGEYNLNHPLKISEAEAKINEAEKALEKTKEGADATEVNLQEISIQDKQSKLNDLILQKKDYTIIAPKDGIIASLNITEGEKISGGGGSSSTSSSSASSSSASSSALAILTSKNKNTVVAINEVDVPNIQKDQKANLTFDALEDLKMTGTVTKIDLIGTQDQGVVYNNVTINFDGYDERIKNGMTVNAEIITNKKENVLLIPSSAVKEQMDGSYIELVTDKNVDMRNAFSDNTSTKLVKVEIGLTDDVNIEINSGLQEGDVIVLSSTDATSSSQATNSSTSTNSGGGSLIPLGGGARGRD